MQNWFKSGDHNAICTKCRQEKLSTEFYLTNNKKPSNLCKECHLENGRRWRKSNPEKANELAKRFREAHYALCLARAKEWRKAN